MQHHVERAEYGFRKYVIAGVDSNRILVRLIAVANRIAAILTRQLVMQGQLFAVKLPQCTGALHL